MDLLILGLAVFSIAWSLANEDGPADLFFKTRNVLRPRIGEGVDCPVCIGMWVSFALFTVYYFFGTLPLMPFAAHGAVTFAVVYLNRQ